MLDVFQKAYETFNFLHINNVPSNVIINPICYMLGLEEETQRWTNELHEHIEFSRCPSEDPGTVGGTRNSPAGGGACRVTSHARVVSDASCAT